MKNKDIPTPLKIRFNIEFISKEILIVESNKKIQSEVLDICENVSTILSRLGGYADPKDSLAEIHTQLNRFKALIKRLDGDKKHINTFMLLITHVADIYTALEIQKEIIASTKLRKKRS